LHDRIENRSLRKGMSDNAIPRACIAMPAMTTPRAHAVTPEIKNIIKIKAL